MRKRYVVFGLKSEGRFKFKEASRAILNTCLQLYGELGSSRLNIWVLEDLFDEKNQRGVVSCSHKKVDQVRAALASISKISNKKVIFYVRGVSGTIQSAKKKFL